MNANEKNATERLLGCEQLERRRLLSASFIEGHLQVMGTDGDDTIAVIVLPGSLAAYVNDSDFVFDVSDYATELLSVTVEGGDGDDVIRVYDPYALSPVGVTLLGGAGNDHLMGTRLNDVLHGGDGNDVLEGYAGNDELYGNRGDDQLFGGEGDDLVIGGHGKDLLSGGGGTDFFDKRDKNRSQILDLDDDDVIMRPNGKWI